MCFDDGNIEVRVQVKLNGQGLLRIAAKLGEGIKAGLCWSGINVSDGIFAVLCSQGSNNDGTTLQEAGKWGNDGDVNTGCDKATTAARWTSGWQKETSDKEHVVPCGRAAARRALEQSRKEHAHQNRVCGITNELTESTEAAWKDRQE